MIFNHNIITNPVYSNNQTKTFSFLYRFSFS
nr:MAG TPA: hypothetical protein [Caudoviricetes sp.]